MTWLDGSLKLDGAKKNKNSLGSRITYVGPGKQENTIAHGRMIQQVVCSEHGHASFAPFPLQVAVIIGI
jgi:hypothetical protein